MKRIIVKASLMAVGVLVLAAGAHGQLAQQYRAQIPFSFEAAGKVHAAGKYTVGPISDSNSPVAIRNLKTGKARMLGLNARGGNNDWDKPGKLIFVKVKGAYHLSEISTPTFGMKLKRARTEVREVASGSAPLEDVVTIYLN